MGGSVVPDVPDRSAQPSVYRCLRSSGCSAPECAREGVALLRPAHQVRARCPRELRRKAGGDKKSLAYTKSVSSTRSPMNASRPRHAAVASSRRALRSSTTDTTPLAILSRPRVDDVAAIDQGIPSRRRDRKPMTRVLAVAGSSVVIAWTTKRLPLGKATLSSHPRRRLRRDRVLTRHREARDVRAPTLDARWRGPSSDLDGDAVRHVVHVRERIELVVYPDELEVERRRGRLRGEGRRARRRPHHRDGRRVGLGSACHEDRREVQSLKGALIVVDGSVRTRERRSGNARFGSVRGRVRRSAGDVRRARSEGACAHRPRLPSVRTRRNRVLAMVLASQPWRGSSASFRRCQRGPLALRGLGLLALLVVLACSSQSGAGNSDAGGSWHFSGGGGMRAAGRHAPGCSGACPRLAVWTGDLMRAGANLFCAAFDGRSQTTCYRMARARADQTCTADVQCASGWPARPAVVCVLQEGISRRLLYSQRRLRNRPAIRHVGLPRHRPRPLLQP